jgi:GH35 family endo-1,4-beta-xylanase
MPRALIRAVCAAAAVWLAVAGPCAARGTGGFLRAWAACGPLETTDLDVPDLPPDFCAYPGLLACGQVWLPAEAEPEGRLDLAALYPGARVGTALLHTFFEVPADGAYVLRVSSDDAVRVRLDGRVIHNHDVRRAYGADQDRVRVTLSRGWHRLLVQVVNYSGEWAMGVRLADEKDEPLDVPHQPGVPNPMASACGLNEPVTADERAAVAVHLARQIQRLEDDLAAALPRLAQEAEGYVTFAEYAGARNQGRMFFEALGTFWHELAAASMDDEAVRAAQHAAVEAARGFSEVLAQQADRLGRALVRQQKAWDALAGDAPTRRRLAEATLQVGELIVQSRRLAARVEDERLLVARFENDIRNYRQRDLAVRVVDADGRPAAGAEVEIVQTSHDFAFGCNLFALRRWDDEKKNALYERRFRQLFNTAVLPLYWSVVERQRGRPQFEAFDAALAWCRQAGVRVRAHPLLWPEAVPRWMDDLSPDDARAAVQNHVRRTIERYRDTVDAWDLLYPVRPEVRLGPARVTPAEVVAWAAAARPRGAMLLSGDEAALLRGVAEPLRGGPLAGVGLTAHQHDGAWPLAAVQEALGRAHVGLPVTVTAVTLLGGPETEAEQAEAVQHFYTAAFANPVAAGITWWDLSDRFAWQNAPAGLVRADLSVKPAYKALDRLLNQLWRTDAAGTADDAGRVRVRAFLGGYRITARSGERKATVETALDRAGPADVEIVLPPGR